MPVKAHTVRLIINTRLGEWVEAGAHAYSQVLFVTGVGTSVSPLERRQCHAVHFERCQKFLEEPPCCSPQLYRHRVCWALGGHHNSVSESSQCLMFTECAGLWGGRHNSVSESSQRLMFTECAGLWGGRHNSASQSSQCLMFTECAGLWGGRHNSASQSSQCLMSEQCVTIITVFNVYRVCWALGRSSQQCVTIITVFNVYRVCWALGRSSQQCVTIITVLNVWTVRHNYHSV